MNCVAIESFFEIIELVKDDQKSPRDYGTGHLVYHSEIKMMDTIYHNPNFNTTDFSKALGVTKGAVTQTMTKLLEKGFISYAKTAGNRREKHYCLTELGAQVRNGYVSYHSEANRKMCAYFSSLDDKQSETIFEFFRIVKEYMPFCTFDCEGIIGCDTVHVQSTERG